MTDIAVQLPEDTIQLIANNHFTVPEFLNLRLISKEFNQALSSKDFLSALYKILCSMDKSLPTVLDSEQMMYDFQMAFRRVKDRQNEEIAFFDLFYTLPENMYRPQINQLLKTPNQTIPQMIYRDELLNNLNECIIDLAIFQNEEEGLTLTGVTRFVYSKENSEYVKKLKSLTLTDCSVTVLDLENHTEIQRIRCSQGKLIFLNLKGCNHIEEVVCDNNKIIDLNIESCDAIEKLRCDNNQIAQLEIVGRLELKGVHCENNPLTSFNASNCQQLSWLHLAGNPKLSNFNIQGCTRLHRVVKDDKTNNLVELNISNTPLEHRSEWQQLKQRVMLRHSSQQLKQSQEKEVDSDYLVEKFSQMSIYTPSFNKENSFSLEKSASQQKEKSRVRRREQLR